MNVCGSIVPNPSFSINNNELKYVPNLFVYILPDRVYLAFYIYYGKGCLLRHMKLEYMGTCVFYSPR